MRSISSGGQEREYESRLHGLAIDSMLRPEAIDRAARQADRERHDYYRDQSSYYDARSRSVRDPALRRYYRDQAQRYDEKRRAYR